MLLQALCSISHWWIQTGVRVRKLSWVLTSVTLTFDLWPWPFAWTSLLTMVIIPENFMMIRWWEHGEKDVTDRRTDRRTENTICRAAWSQLKNMWHGLITIFIMEILIPRKIVFRLNQDPSGPPGGHIPHTLWKFWQLFKPMLWSYCPLLMRIQCDTKQNTNW